MHLQSLAQRAASEAILDEPALLPPAGEVADFVDPPNLNTLVIAVTIVCMVLVTVLLLLRLISRVFIRRKIALGDAFAVAAFANLIALAWVFFRIRLDTPGWFVHQWNFRIKNVIRLGWMVHLGSSFIAVTTMLLKASIIMEWIEIFVPGRQRNMFFWCGWTLVAINTSFYIAGIVSENLSCTPFHSIWDVTVPNRKCFNIKALDVAAAAIDLICDIAITILPQQVIWRLQMSTRTRLGISLLFSIGIFALAASVCRLVANVNYVKSVDSTYWFAPVALWAFARLVALFLIFCLPSIPKALSDLGINSFVMASVRLVTGRSSVKSKNSDGVNPETGPYQVPSNGSKGRKKFNHDSILLTNLSADPTLELPRHSAPSESTEHLRPPVQWSGILRTNTIQQQSSPGTDVAASQAKESFGRQHPWTTNHP